MKTFKNCNWSRRWYTSVCVLDYNYLKEYYKMIAIDLRKQQALDADSKEIQKNSFTGNINRGEDVIHNRTMFFIIKEAKETNFDRSQGTVKVSWIYCTLI